MFLNGILRFINTFIALAVLGIALSVYWFAWRPLPSTGEIEAPIGAEGRIARDKLGIPHISAASLEDAIFLQGYATAQDRLWQMDAIRRHAAGELSEVLGASMIETDREMRRYRLRRLAEQQIAYLPAKDKALLAAYARGVNHFIDTHRNRLPLEFSVLRYEPRPWTIADSMLAGLQMYRSLTNSWRDDLLKSTLLDGGAAEKVNYLFPARSGREIQIGSNAWVISGRHTASGKPILANDPHLEFNLPSTWYLVRIEAPALNVSGASLPGLPCVIIGRNERIAWGVTNLQFDLQDLYFERLDPQTGRYVYQGALRQARAERDVIAVRAQRPAEHNTWITQNGAVVAAEGPRSISLRWTAMEPGNFQFPFLGINQARGWQEFRAALQRFPGPAQNFVYADEDGNIGYQVAGKLPIRRETRGDTILDGSSGARQWDGYIPFDDLPSVYNPPSGIIVTANQNPFPEDYPYPVNGSFASPYRARQIRALLASRSGWKPADMLRIQTDVYSAFSHFLAREVVAAYDRSGTNHAGLKEAVHLLREWDGQMSAGAPAPFLATLIYQHVRKAIAEAASPGKGIAYQFSMAPAVVEKILRERPAGWFSDYDAAILQAAADAADEGRRMQGRDLRKWDYGKLNTLRLPHPILGKAPYVGKYFVVGPVPMSGSSETVKQTTSRVGPSMRMVVSPGNWEESLQNITLGQSGHVLSPNYKDQWRAYLAGTSFPLRFDSGEAGRVLTVKPER